MFTGDIEVGRSYGGSKGIREVQGIQTRRSAVVSILEGEDRRNEAYAIVKYSQILPSGGTRWGQCYARSFRAWATGLATSEEIEAAKALTKDGKTALLRESFKPGTAARYCNPGYGAHDCTVVFVHPNFTGSDKGFSRDYVGVLDFKGRIRALIYGGTKGNDLLKKIQAVGFGSIQDAEEFCAGRFVGDTVRHVIIRMTRQSADGSRLAYQYRSPFVKRIEF